MSEKNEMSEKRLLVVDDEPEFGELVSKVASDLGYQVRVVTHQHHPLVAE